MQLPNKFAHKNKLPLLTADALVIVLAFLAAIALRFDGQIPVDYGRSFLLTLPVIILLYCVFNYAANLYGHLWRYTSAQEVVSILGVTAISTLLLAIVIVIWSGHRPLPFSVIIMGGLFSAGGFTAVRYRNRLFTGFMARLQRVVGSPNRCRVLIVGAGEAGRLLARQMKTDQQSCQYELVGFVDDDVHKQGMRLHGLPILGGREAIPELTTERGVSLIVIAIHNISGSDIRQILSLCMSTQAKVKMLPNVLDTMNSSKNTSLLKDVEPVDLLGRHPHQIDKAACRRLIADKVVLVTGAAGSIGSELCRQILTFNPQQLLLLDNNESSLYDLLVTLKHCQSPGLKVQCSVNTSITPMIADVRDQTKVEHIFRRYRPHLVFHAAAYKHVPLMEQHPDEAVLVNVLGTKIVSQAASRYGVERFVLISTDKAINPSSIMGATKRLAEIMLVNDLSDLTGKNWSPNLETNGVHFVTPRRLHASSTSSLFTAVRFGNVLNSRGSVVPIFTRQIEMGESVTVTHPDMKRYFITIPEAVSLVIQAATLTQGGDIFMLDMGQEIRIIDLAHKMIRLRGLRPEEDIPIEIVGMRPGEKLQEELLGHAETRLPTAHPQIYRIRPDSWQQPYPENLSQQVTRLIDLARTEQPDRMIPLLWQLVKAETEPVNSTQWN